MFEAAIAVVLSILKENARKAHPCERDIDWTWTPPGPLNLYEIHPDPKSCVWYEWDHANVPALQPKRSYTRKQLEDMLNLSPETFRAATKIC